MNNPLSKELREQAKEILKTYTPLNWRKGFLLITYYFLLRLIDWLPLTDAPFYILNWPAYLFSNNAWLAIPINILFSYLIISIIDVHIIEPRIAPQKDYKPTRKETKETT